MIDIGGERVKDDAWLGSGQDLSSGRVFGCGVKKWHVQIWVHSECKGSWDIAEVSGRWFEPEAQRQAGSLAFESYKWMDTCAAGMVPGAYPTQAWLPWGKGVLTRLLALFTCE